jgi:hypothetical protein
LLQAEVEARYGRVVEIEGEEEEGHEEGEAEGG